MDRPLYVRVAVHDRADLDALARIGDLDGVENGLARLYLRPERLPELRALGLAVEVLPDPGINKETGAGPFLASAGPPNWNAYPSYSEYEALMNQWKDECGTTLADICRLVDLGTTTNAARPHHLWAMKVSDSPDIAEDEPEVFLTSTMHGDETTGYTLLLHLIYDLLHGYDPTGTDPDPDRQRITALVNGVEIWINPLANPDGTYFVNDASPNGAIRYLTTASGDNAGVDPNRNFPDPVQGNHPDGEVWWLETQAMMTFAGAHHIALSANLHGGAEVVNYPWDSRAELHPDDAWYQLLSRAFATSAQNHGPAGYMTDLQNGITNGWDWYPVHGGRQDYMNYWHGAREVTIEVSSTKNPAASSLPSYWSWNRDALLGYLEGSLGGVRGVVTETGGAPLAATVELLGHDRLHTQVSTDPAVGDYHRLIEPGSWDLCFSAADHLPATVPHVVVASGPATRLDVALTPAPGSGSTCQICPPVERVFRDDFEGAPCQAPWSDRQP